MAYKIDIHNFTAFRAQADRCFRHAQCETDQDVKQKWLSLGATWLEFSDKIALRWTKARTSSDDPVAHISETRH